MYVRLLFRGCRSIRGWSDFARPRRAASLSLYSACSSLLGSLGHRLCRRLSAIGDRGGNFSASSAVGGHHRHLAAGFIGGLHRAGLCGAPSLVSARGRHVIFGMLTILALLTLLIGPLQLALGQ